jgi:hypothetical protein
MGHLSSKRIALGCVAVALMVGGGWVWLKDASAAACSGTRSHGVSINGGPVVTAVTNGQILITPGRPVVNPNGHTVTPLKVDDTFTHGQVEGLGDLIITLDTSKQAPPSSLISNKPGGQFPATQVIQFYPVFILNGEEFRGDAARVVNSNVDSFPPRPGTVYVLTNAMTLRSDEGNTMTLEPGKAFVIG